MLYTDPAVTARKNLEAHRRVVSKRLGKHETDMPRWLKHRWVAEYHNDFLRRHEEELRENKVDAAALGIDIVDGERRMREVSAVRA